MKPYHVVWHSLLLLLNIIIIIIKILNINKYLNNVCVSLSITIINLIINLIILMTRQGKFRL